MGRAAREFFAALREAYPERCMPCAVEGCSELAVPGLQMPGLFGVCRAHWEPLPPMAAVRGEHRRKSTVSRSCE